MNFLKIALPILLLCTISVSPYLLFGQEKCKVLTPAISGTYEGKCKNGLANGKGIAIGTDKYEGQFSKGLADGEGTYTWSTGEKYVGEWKAGQRNGTGTYTSQVDGKDSIQSGMWKNDKYLGAKPKAPEILYSVGVDRNYIKRIGSAKNRIWIDISQNDSRNKGITNLNISTTSGLKSKIGESIVFTEVVFPVIVRIKYTPIHKTHFAESNVSFEFELFEPGDWTVELFN
ncbi:MAG: hypothetical protein ACOYN4_20455 [Bacteroidales bacterium]